MLKSCPHCGRLHPKGYLCPKKPVPQNKKKFSSEENKFRSKNVWAKKSRAVRKRDGYLCQVCVRGLYQPQRRYQTEGLEVHHIIPLKNAYHLRLEDENLITLCKNHHEMAEAGKIPVSLLKEIAKEQIAKEE